MSRWTGVATCTMLDMARFQGGPYRAFAPEVRLLLPEEVEDPAAVDFALTFVPGEGAFAPYPNLRAIFSVGAGTDGIDACQSRTEVPVFRVEDPDQAQQMAGFAAFHVLWHHRRMGEFLAAQARGAWERRVGDQSPTLRRIGVMGFGLMGRAIAAGLVALGYPVTVLSRTTPRDPLQGARHMTDDRLEAFLAETDILINVLPLTPATQGILNARTFATLPEGAALIQLGRGAHLVEADLLAALDSGQLSGASLDVFETEPLPAGSPLWAHPKLLLTPHVASTPRPEAVVENVKRGMASLD